MFIFCCISALWTLVLTETLAPPIVLTKSGTIFGTRLKYLSREVDAYLGIPYAVPPVGNLRFQKPLPVKPWKQPLNATKFSSACFQFIDEPIPWCDFNPDKSEDCLYLNVYVPRGCSSKPLTVMFWIHGGGYACGSNRLDVYEGRALASAGNVIVVTINYRLTAFGFLYSNSTDAPGNMGLYDIFQALLWVRKNIEFFGGDKNSITIFGQSVGAVTSGIFTISSLTKGLYKRAIMESYAFDFISENEARNIDSGQKLAKAVNCASDSFTLQDHPREVVECLRGVKATTLLQEATIMKIESNDVALFTTQNADDILPRNAAERIKSSQFHKNELFIGVTTGEGSTIAVLYPEIFGPLGQKEPKLNKTFTTSFLRNEIHIDESIINHYFAHLQEYDYTKIKQTFLELLANKNIVCASNSFGERFSRKNPVFFYVFDHRPSYTPWDPELGVAHFDEVAFVFGGPTRQPDKYYKSEIALSERMMKEWASFAKYGFPVRNWPQYNAQQPIVRILNTTYPEPEIRNPQLKECQFLSRYIDF